MKIIPAAPQVILRFLFFFGWGVEPHWLAHRAGGNPPIGLYTGWGGTPFIGVEAVYVPAFLGGTPPYLKGVVMFWRYFFQFSQEKPGLDDSNSNRLIAQGGKKTQKPFDRNYLNF